MAQRVQGYTSQCSGWQYITTRTSYEPRCLQSVHLKRIICAVLTRKCLAETRYLSNSPAKASRSCCSTSTKTENLNFEVILNMLLYLRSQHIKLAIAQVTDELSVRALATTILTCSLDTNRTLCNDVKRGQAFDHGLSRY